MLPTDGKWQDKWSQTAYPPINSNPNIPACYGTDAEPWSSVWLASLCEGLGPSFSEGIRLLDYGCGAGRLCNFISQRLRDFHYFGLEPATHFGEMGIGFANDNFGADPRVSFGSISSPLEKKAIDTATAVVLVSVFTHLAFSNFERICDRFALILLKGGVVSFSAFLADEY